MPLLYISRAKYQDISRAKYLPFAFLRRLNAPASKARKIRK